MGQYELLNELGRGGMGVVYRARQIELGRDVALKTLLPRLGASDEVRKRFMREIRGLMAVSHPNIIRVFDTGHRDGQDYYTMELIEGHSLKELVSNDGPLPLKRAVGLFTQAASGLDACHKAGILHRDVKSANFMIGKEDHLTLMDFGLIRVDGATVLTATGQGLGTPRYMAPEALTDSAPSFPGDVYALGITFLEMVSGSNPFTAETLQELVIQITKEGAPSLGTVTGEASADLIALIDRMVVRDPSGRPTMAEVVHKLESMAHSGAPTTATAPRRTRRTRKVADINKVPPPAPVRTTRGPASLAAVVMLAAAVIGVRAMMADLGRTTPSIVEVPPSVVDAAAPAAGVSPTPLSSAPLKVALVNLEVKPGEMSASVSVVQEAGAVYDVRLQRSSDGASIWSRRIKPDPKFFTIVHGLQPSTSYRLSLVPLDPAFRYLGGRTFSTNRRGSLREARSVLSSSAVLSVIGGITDTGAAVPSDPELIESLLVRLRDPGSTTTERMRVKLVESLCSTRAPQVVEPILGVLGDATLPRATRGRVTEHLGRVHEKKSWDLIVAQLQWVDLVDFHPWQLAAALVNTDRARAHAYFEKVLQGSPASDSVALKVAVVGVARGRFLDLAPLVTTAVLARPAPELMGLAFDGLAALGGDEGRVGIRRLWDFVRNHGWKNKVLERALRALSSCGRQADSTGLLTMLRDPLPAPLRARVVRALGCVGGPGSSKALLERLRDPDPSVRRAAACGLAHQKEGAAVGPLIDRLAVETESWGRIPRALGLLGDQRACEPLLALVNRAPPDEPAGIMTSAWVDRAEALWALGWLRDRRATGSLRANLKSRVDYVRCRAAEGIGWLGDPDAVPALQAAIRQPREEPRVVAACQLALDTLKGRSPFLGRITVIDPEADLVPRLHPERLTMIDPEADVVPLGIELRPGEYRQVIVQGCWSLAPDRPVLLDTDGLRTVGSEPFLSLRLLHGAQVDRFAVMEERVVGGWLGAEVVAEVDRPSPGAYGFMSVWVDDKEPVEVQRKQ